MQAQRKPQPDPSPADVAPINEKELAGFIQDWHHDPPSRKLAQEMGRYLFGFLHSLESYGASDRTLRAHESNVWAIGKFECDYGYHDSFSPDIFLGGPSWESKFRRKHSDSNYAMESYRKTWRELDRYTRKFLGPELSVAPEPKKPALKSQKAPAKKTPAAKTSRSAPPTPDSPSYTKHQGQVLSFIHYYSLVIGQPPAQSDIQRFFGISGPAAHQMVVTLEKRELLHRVPGQSRAIRVLVPVAELPDLEPPWGAPPPVKVWTQR